MTQANYIHLQSSNIPPENSKTIIKVNYIFKWKLDPNAAVLGNCEIITFGLISTESYSSCQKLRIEVAILKAHYNPWSASRFSTVHQTLSFILPFVNNCLTKWRLGVSQPAPTCK